MRIPVKPTSPVRAGSPLLLAIALVVFACAAASAAAETACSTCRPWWHVNTVYAPAQKTGGEGTVVVEVSNLGDAPTNGTFFEHVGELFRGETKGYIKVVDKLPAGLTVTEAREPAHAEGNGTENARSSERELESLLRGAEESGASFPKLCSVAGQTVTCLYAAPVRPYERIDVMIQTVATPGAATGVSEVSVSGGGVQPVSSRRAISPDEVVPSFGVENYEVTPEEEGGSADTQAGSHPFQLTTTLALNTQTVQAFKFTHGAGKEVLVPEVQPLALTKDLHFNIPPGLIGNPEPLPRCSLSTFTQEGEAGHPDCPLDTVIGVSSPIVTGRDPRYDNPLVGSEPVYNLEPAVGEPARFGFQTVVGPVILDTSVRTGGDYGVVVSVPNIAQVPLLGDQLTFWGVPADSRHDDQRGRECLSDFAAKREGGEELSCGLNEKPQPFLIMPTSCTGPLHTSVEADSWSEPGAFGAPGEYTFQTGAGGEGEPYGLDGCNRLSFESSIQVAPDGQQGSTPTGLTVGVHVSQQAELDPTGLADSTVRDTTVALPAGVGLNPAGADGLLACSTEQVGLNSPAPVSCPEASKVATVEIHSPLLPEPLVGAAYLAEQDANPFGSLIALYIVAEDPTAGVLIKVAGEVKPDPVTGQLVATFNETPQLPFEDLSLHFFGGSRAPLGTPALCGGYTSTASIAPWSGKAPVSSSSEFEITSGPNGAPCARPVAVRPVVDGGYDEYPGGWVQPVHDDDESRRRRPEPAVDPAAHAAGSAGDALQCEAVWRTAGRPGHLWPGKPDRRNDGQRRPGWQPLQRDRREGLHHRPL